MALEIKLIIIQHLFIGSDHALENDVQNRVVISNLTGFV